MKRIRPTLTAVWEPLKPLSGRDWFLGAGTVALVIFWQINHRSGFFLHHFAALIHDPVIRDLGRFVWYHSLALLLLGVFPALMMKCVWKVPLRSLGFGLGNRKLGLAFLVIALPIALISVIPSSFDPVFQREYPLSKLAGYSVGSFVLWELIYALYYLGWEPYFRGTLLFGLRGSLGDLGAIFFQTAISCFVHIGKPPGEFLSSLLAGFVFGAAALRIGSFWWIFVLHWTLGAAMDLACVLQRG